MNKWNKISEVPPPNRKVIVKDKNNIEIEAQPTYYPFRMEDGEVVTVPLFWDGGWLADLKYMNMCGEYIEWKEIENNEI